MHGIAREVPRPLPLSETAEAGAPETSTLQAPLTFICPQAEKPVLESAAFTAGAPRHHFATDSHSVAIPDLRSRADSLALDSQGSGLRLAPTAVDDLYDEAAREGASYRETWAFLVDLTRTV